MKRLSIVFMFTILQCLDAVRQNFFRKDYKFIESTNTFYKFHSISLPWRDAKKSCEMEGTNLYYPENEAESNAVIQFWNETQPSYYIFIGVSSLLVKGVFETIDGLPIDDVYSKWNFGEPNDAGGKEDCVVMGRHNGGMNDDECAKRFPYICKKPKADVEWNTPCDIPDLSYTYSEQMSKCYKFHIVAKNWTDAYATCRAEQSYLAVINSQEEADYLKKITVEAPKDKAVDLDMAGAVFLGFHNRLDNQGWLAINGKKLESTGYSKWSYGQPDGKGNEKCGSMFYDGTLNDMTCSLKCFFICEHDIDILGSMLDDRIADSFVKYVATRNGVPSNLTEVARSIVVPCSVDLNDIGCENKCQFLCEQALGDGVELFDERFGTD